MGAIVDMGGLDVFVQSGSGVKDCKTEYAGRMLPTNEVS